MSDKPSAEERAVDALFKDMRDRRSWKWDLDPMLPDRYIGDDVVEEIRNAWLKIVKAAADACEAKVRAELRESELANVERYRHITGEPRLGLKYCPEHRMIILPFRDEFACCMFPVIEAAEACRDHKRTYDREFSTVEELYVWQEENDRLDRIQEEAVDALRAAKEGKT